MLIFSPQHIYAGLYCFYSAALVRDQVLLVRDTTPQIRGRSRAQPYRGGCIPRRGTSDIVGQQGGRVPIQTTGNRSGHFYAFHGRLEAKASDAIITSIIPDCHRLTSVLFDLRSIYSYVFAYFSMEFDLLYERMPVPGHVSTPVGDSFSGGLGVLILS